MKGSRKTKIDRLANERDEFKCIKCASKKSLETHHVLPNIEELNNLMTLCHSCHKKEHNMAGCFKKGYDPRRNVIAWEEGKLKGQLLLKELNKTRTHYFNRYIRKWVQKPSQGGESVWNLS